MVCKFSHFFVISGYLLVFALSITPSVSYRYLKSSRLLMNSLHLVENLYRPLVPPPNKILCYAAIADLFKYLPECKANPQDVVVRQKLQLAAWMSLWPTQLETHRFVEVKYESPGTTSLTNNVKCVGFIACSGTQAWSDIWDRAWNHIGEGKHLIDWL